MNSYEPVTHARLIQDQASNSSYRDGDPSPGPALPEDPLAVDKCSGRETFFFEAEVGFLCIYGKHSLGLVDYCFRKRYKVRWGGIRKNGDN